MNLEDVYYNKEEYVETVCKKNHLKKVDYNLLMQK